MAYCEFCPLNEACAKIDKFFIEYPPTDHREQIIIAAFRKIFSIEATDYSPSCEDGIPAVEREFVDKTGEYELICSDERRQGLADYFNQIVPIAADWLSEEEFGKQYPWVSITERLSDLKDKYS
ncbi:MAG TPA: hypothetical protein VMR95_00965 [Candidatus Binatia bacterium]|jgi:hypothetical protein|nr:hypothetical protein [Candidatus Binatia bacterium]